MASMFWVPTSAAEPAMPGYDYDPRWFCDRTNPKKCPPGWPGWRWDQTRAASLGRAYNYAHASSFVFFFFLCMNCPLELSILLLLFLTLLVGFKCISRHVSSRRVRYAKNFQATKVVPVSSCRNHQSHGISSFVVHPPGPDGRYQLSNSFDRSP